MGQINLYKIDRVKSTEFLNKLIDKFECIGEQNYTTIENKNKQNYTVTTYVSKQEERKMPEWKWLLDEYEYPVPNSLAALKAVLVIQREDTIYAATYGMAYFSVDKYCDTSFAFDFARRVKFKQVKTTTLTAPNSQRNKTVNVYLDYSNFSYDSGEAYAKIKAKMDVEDGFAMHNEVVEIGHSIKTRLPEDSIECILNFIEYVEKIQTQDEVQKIPVFYKIKDEDLIQKLDDRLGDKIRENIECINISELDIIGVTEVFNHNDMTFTLKYKRKSMETEVLSKAAIEQFIKEIKDFDFKQDFLKIKVVSNRNGEPIRTDLMKWLIDYTDDEMKCLLMKGEWYEFNDDYLSYLQDSIDEIDVEYDPQYNFGEKELSKYREEKYRIEKSLPENRGEIGGRIKK